MIDRRVANDMSAAFGTPRGMSAKRDMGLAGRTLQRTMGAVTSNPLNSTRDNLSFAAVEPGLMVGAASAVDAASSAAVYAYPMNLSLSERLLSMAQPKAGQFDRMDEPSQRKGQFDIDSEALVRLQLDVNDYIESLDARLRGLVTHPNTALAKRMRDTSNVPLSFSYFRLQQKMMRLSGDLTMDKERAMLTKLANALSVE